jgi:hypothetical protein
MKDFTNFLSYIDERNLHLIASIFPSEHSNHSRHNEKM